MVTLDGESLTLRDVGRDEPSFSPPDTVSLSSRGIP